MTMDVATMRHRFAAQSVIEELLRLQGGVPRRSPVARFFGVSPLGPDSAAWYLGAKGEQAVGSLLETLPPEWTVFHALPVGARDSDIDHVVVGPAGIFTINSKHHRGTSVWVAGSTVMVAGRETRYVRDAEFEAARVTRLVKHRMPRIAPAHPVVALVDPQPLTIRERPANVTVIDARRLPGWLLSLPPVLAWPERMEITAIIDNPATWRQPDASAPSTESRTLRTAASSSATPADDPVARFAALDAEVRSARTRRVLWSLFAVVATTGAAVVAAPALSIAVMEFLLSTG